MDTSNIFMTGNWKDLIMSTYNIDKSILKPYLPINTEIDLYNGKALISLVAFTFSNVNFFGFKIPRGLGQRPTRGCGGLPPHGQSVRSTLPDHVP